MRKFILMFVVPSLLWMFLTACSSNDEKTGLEKGDVVHFTLLQTTDVHHHAVGTGPSASYAGENDTTRGGYSRLARQIMTIRTVNGAVGIPTMLVDSGDYFMGTVYDMSLGESPAALNFFEFMGYDAITIGNHELDYGPTPLSNFFNLAIGDGPVSGFTVPVIASNMVTSDDAEDTGDDGLEALKSSGVIKDYLIKTLDNGLKVGIIGLLGKSAASDAPVKAPLTFTNDLSDNAVVAEIQSKVNAVRSAGVHVVIALSHSGITDPNGTPGGDDVTLAQKVTGIDIIASGHNHEMTDDIVTVNGTKIICAGRYGENLAQLDVAVTIGGSVSATLINNPIDSRLIPANVIQVLLVGALDSGISEVLVENGLPAVNDIIAETDSDNLDLPEGPGETGIGNLCADSLRYLLGASGAPYALSIVANGVIRNGYALDQEISFADIYNTLPLGMTLDPANQGIPGYPLVVIYLNPESVRNMCQLAAYTILAGDEATMALLANPLHPMHAMYPILLNLKEDYYLNFSGLSYTYGAGFAVAESSVKLFNTTDFSCQTEPLTTLDSLPDAALIPCVVDLYTALMFLDPSLQGLLTAAGLPIAPKVKVGDDYVALSHANVMGARVDFDDETPGVQEVKEWMALYQFVTKPAVEGGLEGEILNELYGTAALSSVNASRVNP